MVKALFTIACCLFINIALGQTYAIIADKLIDCKNQQVLENPTVIVHKGRIVDVNYKNNIPDSAIVINLKGYTLLPGLMDVHTHILSDGGDYDKDLYNNSPSYRSLRAAKYLSMLLQRGFTTIRDVCSEGAGYADYDISRAVDSSFIAGPRVIPAGKGIAATGRYLPSARDQNWELTLPVGTQYASGHDECLRVVREQISHGLKWIKLYADWRTPTFNYDEIKTIVDEAKKYGVNVAAHATSREGIKMAIQAGVRSIEHGDEFNDSLINMALEKHVYWSPTITVMEYYKQPMDSLYKYLNRACKLKLKIVLGTDIGSFPWNINDAKELEYYVKKAGFTPMDAIKTATINSAELLNRQDNLGQIRKSFIADIIAVKGNPLDDITLLQKVAFVMKNGVIYKKPVN
ncbi:MAG: amidohydrolase family protein [Mucilaginibacter sp.]